MRIAVLSLLICAAATSAGAQPPLSSPPAPKPRPRDPIAVLLNPNGPGARDEDEPDTAGQTGAQSDVQTEVEGAPGREGVSPGPPIPFAMSPRSQREVPVNIDQTALTPDGPPDIRAQAYDARIRASFAAAQGFLGPLDGGWTLSGNGWKYSLQIVDRRDRLEAVWRNPDRVGALDASGMVDSIVRSGSTLNLSFEERPARPVKITLHNLADGRWRGEASLGEERFAVTMERTSP